jgi:NitT/TauT family transport system permease protein
MDWQLSSSPVRRGVLGFGFAAALIIAWQMGAATSHPTINSVPTPAAILGVITKNLPIMWPHVFSTTSECIIGFIIAAAAGTLIGGLIAYSRFALEAMYPHVVFFQIIPKIALAPLFVVWLGVGSTSRLAFAVFSSFFPTLIAALIGLQATRPAYIRLCEATMAPKWRGFLLVRFPFALPYIFSGLKIAVTMAIIGVVIGEFITAQIGLGYIIKFAASAMDMSLVFAAATLLCVIGLALYGAVALAERLVMARYGT